MEFTNNSEDYDSDYDSDFDFAERISESYRNRLGCGFLPMINRQFISFEDYHDLCVKINKIPSDNELEALNDKDVKYDGIGCPYYSDEDNKDYDFEISCDFDGQEPDYADLHEERQNFYDDLENERKIERMEMIQDFYYERVNINRPPLNDDGIRMTLDEYVNYCCEAFDIRNHRCMRDIDAEMDLCHYEDEIDLSHYEDEISLYPPLVFPENSGLFTFTEHCNNREYYNDQENDDDDVQQSAPAA